jgi:hypothetical protein
VASFSWMCFFEALKGDGDAALVAAALGVFIPQLKRGGGAKGSISTKKPALSTEADRLPNDTLATGVLGVVSFGDLGSESKSSGVMGFLARDDFLTPPASALPALVFSSLMLKMQPIKNESLTESAFKPLPDSLVEFTFANHAARQNRYPPAAA